MSIQETMFLILINFIMIILIFNVVCSAGKVISLTYGLKKKNIYIYSFEWFRVLATSGSLSVGKGTLNQLIRLLSD